MGRWGTGEEFGGWNLELGIPNSEFRIQNSES
jgi:hypothetical protein